MSISLLGSINVCKVNTGYADKIQSDRFENPSNMLCPLWQGQDSYGRFVNADSYYTKSAGCNSSADRVVVENYLRPQYMEYVALDAAGFRANDMFGNPNSNNTSNNVRENFQEFATNSRNNMFVQDTANTAQQAKDYYRIVGSAGYQYNSTNTPYDTGMRGVDGGSGMGIGACGRRNPQNNIAEGFVDTRANRNFDNRRALSAVQGYKSRCTSCSSGSI